VVACHEPLQHKKHPLGSNLQSNLCQTGGLADAGLTADGHGATADRPAFARTDASVLPTTERLKAAAGSAMLPQEQAHNLIEAFEVVQRLRLRYQIEHYVRSEKRSDLLVRDRLSPIDRSMLAQAVQRSPPCSAGWKLLPKPPRPTPGPVLRTPDRLGQFP
jgi:hypothetical protein